MYSVYIIYSSKLGKFYKGITKDLFNRVQRHNNGTESFTKKGIPWVLIWSLEKESRSEAMLLEKKLKNLNQDRLIQFMLKYENEISGRDEKHLLMLLSRC